MPVLLSHCGIQARGGAPPAWNLAVWQRWQWVRVGPYRPGMATQDSDQSADVDSAPDPDSPQFLSEQNTAEKVSPGNSADAPATDAGLIPTHPTLSDGE